jgi:HEAT repeat protein
MSENLHRGKEPAGAVAPRRWRVCILAITALLMMAAGIGVVLMESTSRDTPQGRVRALVAEIERYHSDDGLSKLPREYFPDYGKSRNRYEVSGELAALGAVAVPEIITATEHKLPSVRWAAVRALGEIGDRRAVAPLAYTLARDSESDVREEAATSLGQLGGPEATDRLIKALAVSEPSVSCRIAWALCQIGGPDPTARLIEAMANSDPDVRGNVAMALGTVGGPEPTARLIEAMADSEPLVRYNVASALGKVGGPEATARLIEAMADSNPIVRLAVAGALGAIGDTAATNILMRALDDKEDVFLRSAAARAIGEIGDRQCLPRLIELLNDPAACVRVSSAHALAEIGDTRATPALLAALTDADACLRAEAASSLGLLRDPRAIDTLLSTLNDKDEGVRNHSAIALALQKRPEAVPVLAATVTEKIDRFAVRAVVGLALIDTPDARQSLEVAARKAREPAVRRFAARAMAMPIVEAMAKELREKDCTLHSSIYSAFAYLRDPASFPALEEAINSPDSNIRYIARWTIRHIRRASQPQAASAPAKK